MEGGWNKLLFFGTFFILVDVTHQTGIFVQEYILITELKMSWLQAQNFCRVQYGDLATISGDDDISRINELNWDQALWIGLYDDVDGWRWSLDDEGFYAGVEQDFRPWQEDQPDNAGAAEHCVSMMEDGFWRDNSCTLVKMPLVCFRDGAGVQVVLVTEEKSWLEAQSYCRQHHTDLISVRSPAENREVQNLLEADPAVQEVWIGLHRDSWRWSDGSSFSFTYWWNLQPDNEQKSEACVATQGGRWSDFSCDAEFNVLCQQISEVILPPQNETINPAVQRATVKMKLQTNSNLKDPIIRHNVLLQFEAALKFEGFTEVRLIWKNLRAEPQPTERGSILLSLRITHQAANLALGGEAAQSSLSKPWLSPNMVIDGKPHSHHLLWSCVSTLEEDDPWWRVDLGRSYDISMIVITRRSDCCASELRGAEIRIGNSLENNGNNNPRCEVITGTYDITMTFHCSHMRGRYVNIVLPGVDKTLHLCEVKVFAAAQVTGANVALGGVAAQSSLLDPVLLPNLVIDGKPYSHYFYRSCVSTVVEDDPWWRVDLRGPYHVFSVEVIQRSDCCASELNGAEIRIGDSLENNGNNNSRCAVITVTSDVVMTFSCNRMRGRYVSIFLPGVKRRLQLCEVKVFAVTHLKGVNIARRGVASLSAEPASAFTGPNKAIDEHPGPKHALETCASVQVQDNPWWQLDLKGIYRITAVSITAVGDCCLEELNGAEVRIGLSSDTSNQRCAIISVVEGQHQYNYHCGIMDGRYVHVVLPGLWKTLTVCEVQVFGTVLENVALRGVAFQSSSRSKTGYEASRAIDGRRATTCSSTKNTPGQWWTVDLLVPYNVTVIQLAYSKSCCHNDEVRVDNTSCEVVSSDSRYLVTMDCGGTVGRHVTVFHPDKPERLCEVEVYSTQINLQNRFPQRPALHDYCSSVSCSRDYILVHNEPKTWPEAWTYCRQRFADLATINGVGDMNRVVDKMENSFNDFWIGLHKDAMTWRWSLSADGYYGDGEADFRMWGDGEPSDVSGVQQCVAIRHTGEWRQLDCDALNFFFCFDGKNAANKTKILVEEAVKWTDAQRFCRENHTDLLSVRNLTENQEIQSMVPLGKRAWIGLFGESWKWSDASRSSFRYWSQDPPDSGGPDQSCVHVYDGKWSVKSCNTRSMFLCYYLKEKKRSVLKISAAFNMSDPVVQQQILIQLEAEMRKKGVNDVKIGWMSTRQQSFLHQRALQSVNCSVTKQGK